jgi:hypothetical protein
MAPLRVLSVRIVRFFHKADIILVRRSFELESEIRQLRMQLESQSGPTPSSTVPDWSLPPESAAFADTASQSYIPPEAPTRQANVTHRPAAVAASLTSASPGTATGPSPDPTEHSRAPGLTTRPGVDEPLAARRVSLSLPRPRALGNTALSVDEIDELFMM